MDAQGMKDAYLDSNVFVLPSTIENSPNSLGEAMLLGVPCVAADVGGVTTMMTHDTEGYIYQSTAPYMLAHNIKLDFAMEENAAGMGLAARAHALDTHDPETNLQDLLSIYRVIGG
jgi:glycosyltransferase involved in cell wall biosynthesis